MRTTYVNKSLPVELGEDIVVKSYKRGSPEAVMPIIDPKPSYLILSYLILTPGFIGLGQDNFKTRRETFQFGIGCVLY